MQPPKTLRIMGRDFDVQHTSDDPEHDGACFPHECRISISEGLHPIEEADTLIHEVIHAIHYLLNIGLSYNMEEKVVRLTATGLIQVFNDNPELLTYFAEVGRKKT